MYQLNPGNLPLNVRASHLYISKLKVSTCILNFHVGVLGSLLAGGQCGHAETILDSVYLHKGVDVVEWSRALDVRLSEWCCSISMAWVQIPSREEQKIDSSKI
jgi:hypothetical protein